MNRLAPAISLISILIGAAIGCSSSAADPDSETHWLRKCNADSDCEQGLTCLCNTCTRACQRGDCKSLDASATCLTLTEALSDACQLAPGIALCGKMCTKDADCSSTGAGLRCVGGACLAGAPTSSANRTTSISTWVADLVDAYCTWGVRCEKFPDGATCHASRGRYFVTEGFNSASAAVTAVSKGTADFDDAAATACLAAMSQLDCGSDFWARPSLPASCTETFSGHVPDGGSCIDDVECGTGLVCLVQSTVTCEGTCTLLAGSCRTDADCPGNQSCVGVPWWGPGLWVSGSCSSVIAPGAAGEPCGMPVQCAQGLTCLGGPAPALCGDAATEGESCGGFNGPECAPGLACAASNDGKTFTCMHGAKLGDSCTSLFQCGAQYAYSDLICDVGGSNTCVRRPSTGSCVLANGLNTCDPVASYCDGSGGGGTCKPWLSLGAPCVFPTDGLDPCGPAASCQGSGTAAQCVSTVAPACTPS